MGNPLFCTLFFNADTYYTSNNNINKILYTLLTWLHTSIFPLLCPKRPIKKRKTCNISRIRIGEDYISMYFNSGFKYMLFSLSCCQNQLTEKNEGKKRNKGLFFFFGFVLEPKERNVMKPHEGLNPETRKPKHTLCTLYCTWVILALCLTESSLRGPSSYLFVMVTDFFSGLTQAQF